MTLAEFAACDMEWWHRLASAHSAWVEGRNAAQGVRQWQRDTVDAMRGGRE